MQSLLPQTEGRDAASVFRWTSLIRAALLHWWLFACGLMLASFRVLSLGLVLAMAFAHAAILRLTGNPAAAALARSRTAWFHRWSTVACWVLGLQIERQGFVPVSGLVIVNDHKLLDALLLGSVAPFVFVLDMGVRRRPVVGWVARLAGALFCDRKRRSDVVRINFMIERALWRRQLVVVFRIGGEMREPILDVFPSALLQSAVASKCSLTAAAICDQLPEAASTAAVILTRLRSRMAVLFHPPAFHYGDRKQLARQVWREIQALESKEIIGAHSSPPVGELSRDNAKSPPRLATTKLLARPLYAHQGLV